MLSGIQTPGDRRTPTARFQDRHKHGLLARKAQSRKRVAMRFVLINDNPEFPDDGKTCWYWDTNRPLEKDYVAVECYCDKDPNQFVYFENLRILYTDQAEYCFVCSSCYFAFSHMQWSGSTHSPGWREISQRELKIHQKYKGWCEFCDPIFGNGGWITY